MSIGSTSPCKCNLGSSLLRSQEVALDSTSPSTETPLALVEVVGQRALPASRFKCACGWYWMKTSSCLAWIFTLITTVEACDKDTTMWDELAGGGGGQETSSKLAQFRWYRTEKIWGSKYAVLTIGFSGREEECHWLTVRVADLSFLHSLPPPKDNGLHLSSFSILPAL